MTMEIPRVFLRAKGMLIEWGTSISSSLETSDSSSLVELFPSAFSANESAVSIAFCMRSLMVILNFDSDSDASLTTVNKSSLALDSNPDESLDTADLIPSDDTATDAELLYARSEGKVSWDLAATGSLLILVLLSKTSSTFWRGASMAAFSEIFISALRAPVSSAASLLPPLDLLIPPNDATDLPPPSFFFMRFFLFISSWSRAYSSAVRPSFRPSSRGDSASCLICAGPMSPDDGRALPLQPDRGFVDDLPRAMVRPAGLPASPGTALLISRPTWYEDILVLWCIGGDHQGFEALK
mmetsp:Transcript_18912/g.44314  ORF Transcript_18912/g.44314 Transcript_18912/m.44314 type:complete len:297 (-) Transcript_18912:142-1032(-)